ncbi:hypothetical protein DSY14_19770 [Nocardiopsis sp. MG754419]|nr:hypothetical protein [Nocardiopsis sp. MG754419]
MLVLTLVAGCSGPLGDAEARSYDTVPRPLIVEGDNAELALIASDNDGIRVTREDSGQAGGEWGLEGDTLTLGSDCAVFSRCHVRYVVALPADVELSVRTDNGTVSLNGFTSAVEVTSENGTVRATDLSGALDLASENGDLELDGITSGTVAMATDNGTVDATFASRPTDVEVSTNNGAATLTLPDGPYAVFETVGNGRIDAEIDTEDDADSTVNARTENGTITLVPLD